MIRPREQPRDRFGLFLVLVLVVLAGEVFTLLSRSADQASHRQSPSLSTGQFGPHLGHY